VASRPGPGNGAGRPGCPSQHDPTDLASIVEIASFTPEFACLAVDAWEPFGKGRRPAGLDIIDCRTYALAAQTGESLLAVDGDFERTDIQLVELVH
jgi:uncharacterized protein with PIN domain